VVQIYFLPFLVIGVTVAPCLWIVAVPVAISVVAVIVYENWLELILVIATGAVVLLLKGWVPAVVPVRPETVIKLPVSSPWSVRVTVHVVPVEEKADAGAVNDVYDG
jgi:hypothetical protein